jgi:hypothetical protein
MRIAQHLISGGTQTKAPPSIAAHIASNAIDFFRVMKKSQLLPLNAADRAWSNPIGAGFPVNAQLRIMRSGEADTRACAWP